SKLPLGFFSPSNNAIVINPRMAGKQTIFHEYAHPLMNWIKKDNPALYAEGLSLLQGTKYETHIKKYGIDEAIVYAIGEKGAQIQDQYNRNKFVAWTKKVWMKARIAFKRLFNIDLTLDEFTSMVSYAMRSGEPIMPVTKKKLVKPQFMQADEQNVIGDLNLIAEMREKYHAGAYEDQSEFLQTLAKEKRHFSEVARAKKYWNEIVADKVEMPKPEPFDIPVEKWYQYIQRQLQDKYNRATQVVKKAREKGETISDETDFRLEMELYVGRASDQIETFQKQITNGKDGFLERLTDAGLDWQDLSLYMYAKHAPERNETIRGRDPENDAGSGMTDEEAQEVLNEFEAKGLSDRLENFADQYYDIVTKPTLDILFDAGLLSEKEYESYTHGWKYYVPLKGIEQQQTFRMRGKGFSVEYKGIIKARGRHSLAKNNPFIQAIMDHEDAIIRAEKNKVGQSFLDFVMSHRNARVKGKEKTLHCGR
ncbi:MAG TPA: hypothetical protein VMW10_12460, partial [Alphaproteobacteria bacterium]|nr:hypothetical protein [Alphaproteobacteria bacterium]